MLIQNIPPVAKHTGHLIKKLTQTRVSFFLSLNCNTYHPTLIQRVMV